MISDPHRGPVNLDSLGEEELRLACFHPALHAQVRRYASLVLRTRRLRQIGEVQAALRFEQEMDGVFAELPEWARW
jgi:hypothetical protein